MKKQKLLTSFCAFILILSLGACELSEEEKLEGYQKAYDLLTEFELDISSWDSIEYNYLYEGYEEYYTSWAATGEPVTVIGQETDTEYIVAKNENGKVKGIEQWTTTHHDSYINGGRGGYYYDGALLYSATPLANNFDGGFRVDSEYADISLSFFLENPQYNLDSIVSIYKTYTNRYMDNFHYSFSGSVKENKNGETFLTLRVDYSEYSYDASKGEGTLTTYEETSLTYDSSNELKELTYTGYWLYDFDNYYNTEDISLSILKYEGEINTPSWIYGIWN